MTHHNHNTNSHGIRITFCWWFLFHFFLVRPGVRVVCGLVEDNVLADWEIDALMDSSDQYPHDGKSDGVSAAGRTRSNKHTPQLPQRKVGVLMGIFTADTLKDNAYRIYQRKLFQIWNDPRVCSLAQLQARPVATQYECELVYTFVLGANTDPAAPMYILSEENTHVLPLLAPKPYQVKLLDANDDDVTGLNIKENMNEGKSQTYLYFGAKIAKEYGLDYVLKCDADASIHLHEFFAFAYQHLVSKLDNTDTYYPLPGVFAGALRNKYHWPDKSVEETRKLEGHFQEQYDSVHLYLAGQFYLLSTKLASSVANEAHNATCPPPGCEYQCWYCEGHEDHDISTMVFRTPHPIHLITITRGQRYWEHPVKSGPRWKRIVQREIARTRGVPFENKIFPTDSDWESVVVRQDSKLIDGMFY